LKNSSYNTVLITGASAGIGEAFAIKFAEAGYDLILLARRIEKLESLKEKIQNTFKVNVNIFDVDVRNNKHLTNIVEQNQDIFAKVDILVNNAGLALGLEKIQNGVLDNWETMIDTNIKGLLYISRLILPIMVNKQKGLLINIASIAGREMYPSGNVYSATKSAVRALSKSMNIDLNGTGVKVCNIDPGMVETEFSLVRFNWDKEKAQKVYNGFTPLFGEDIANIGLWIASMPQHINIQDLLVTPTDQATATITNRKL
jgi:NADP-dependent 3-hydroxy acid dehydrogenase YdfG